MFYLSESRSWRAKRVTVLILIVLIGLGVGGFFVYKNIFALEVNCNKLEKEIFAFLEQVNYCDTDSDCIVEGGGLCPFGCFHLVYKDADLTELRKSEKQFSKNCFYCEYECVEAPTAEDIKCINRKCVDVRFLP